MIYWKTLHVELYSYLCNIHIYRMHRCGELCLTFALNVDCVVLYPQHGMLSISWCVDVHSIQPLLVYNMLCINIQALASSWQCHPLPLQILLLLHLVRFSYIATLICRLHGRRKVALSPQFVHACPFLENWKSVCDYKWLVKSIVTHSTHFHIIKWR